MTKTWTAGNEPIGRRAMRMTYATTAEPKQPITIGTTSRAVAYRQTRRYTPRATKKT
jgi:hypothetical protein